MSLFIKKQKTWEVYLDTIREIQLIEVCEPKGCSNFVAIYLDFLQTLLKKWPLLFASQVIDIREFTTREYYNYLSTAVNNQDISMSITKSMTDSNALTQYENNFSIHVVSKNSVNWIPSILRFGTVSWPHIVYCYDENDKSISAEILCQMNSQFKSWFQNPSDDEQIVQLSKKSSMIYWGNDYRLFFLSSKQTMNYVIDIIEQIGKENELKIKLFSTA